MTQGRKEPKWARQTPKLKQDKRLDEATNTKTSLSSMKPSKSCVAKDTKRQHKTTQLKTITTQHRTRQDNTITRQDKTRQDKTRQDKTRQDKTRQDKTRQDKTIQHEKEVGGQTDSNAKRKTR